MTTNNDTYRKSVMAAETTKIAAVAAAQSTYLSAITAAGCDMGHRPTDSNGFATYDASIRAANAAKIQAYWDAERVKQAAILAAKETLRGSGEAPT